MDNKVYNEGCKHPGKYYVCRRLRTVSYLKKLGIFPVEVIPDVNNPRYNVFRFINTPELEEALEAYFAKLHEGKVTTDKKVEIEHKNEYYTCKRLRLLRYLREKGFIPYETVPELDNPKYYNWRFKNTPELEKAVTEFFEQLK